MEGIASCLVVVSLGVSCKVWQSFHAEAQKRATPQVPKGPSSEMDGDRWSTALEGTFGDTSKTNKYHSSLLQCRVGFQDSKIGCLCRVVSVLPSTS